MRRAGQGLLSRAGALILTALASLPAPTLAQPNVTVMAPSPATVHPWPVRATLTAPTDRYPHNVLGPIPELLWLPPVVQEVFAPCDV